MLADLVVGLDARIPTGVSGGVEQVLVGLAQGLANLGDQGERYVFLANPDQRDWLAPYVEAPVAFLDPAAAPAHRQAARRIPGAALAWRHLRRSPHVMPASDGAIERRGVQVMHFTLQFSGFKTSIPSLYQPHDLQHMHYPEFFTKDQLIFRDQHVRAWSQQASKVIVMSSWGKADVMAMLDVSSERIRVVPWAPVLDFYPIPSEDDLAVVQRKWDLPPRFIFYPAQTWRHKNHLRLIQALAVEKGRGRKVTLVCTGALNEYHPTLADAAIKAGVASQIRFLGYVNEVEIRALYRLATALVFPSLFEGWGMPVLEAFRECLPVACSTSCMLPALVGGAAVLFDPLDADAIASAIEHLMDDEALRDRLRTDGLERAAEFTWDRTAQLLRATYRETAGIAPSTVDAGLLASKPSV
jgi:glycosyltransferase involved in cell wall biosynthesis